MASRPVNVAGVITADTDLETSRSLCSTDTIKGSHKFTITGYSLMKGIGYGKYVSSETFHVGGYDWAMYFYPDGKNEEDNAECVSLFIALASEGNDVRALFELAMLDRSDKGNHKIHSHFGRMLETGPYNLKYKGSMWGYKRFFKRVSLENSIYLKDDTLELRCTVGVVTCRTTAPRAPPVVIPPCSLSTDLGSLFDSEEFKDVTFLVDGETVSAHKLILCARSPVFKAMLTGPMREGSENRITIPEVRMEVFKILLRFVYTGQVDEELDTAMTQHLLAAADQFGLDRLRVICEKKLADVLDPQTVAITLALAEQHNAGQLRKEGIEYAALHLKEVMASEGWAHMSSSCPSLHADLLKEVARRPWTVAIQQDGPRTHKQPGPPAVLPPPQPVVHGAGGNRHGGGNVGDRGGVQGMQGHGHMVLGHQRQGGGGVGAGMVAVGGMGIGVPIPQAAPPPNAAMRPPPVPQNEGDVENGAGRRVRQRFV
eukprot:jgi/Mesvir1/21617/Mv04040-RA.1